MCEKILVDIEIERERGEALRKRGRVCMIFEPEKEEFLLNTVGILVILIFVTVLVVLLYGIKNLLLLITQMLILLLHLYVKFGKRWY